MKNSSGERESNTSYSRFWAREIYALRVHTIGECIYSVNPYTWLSSFLHRFMVSFMSKLILEQKKKSESPVGIRAGSQRLASC